MTQEERDRLVRLEEHSRIQDERIEGMQKQLQNMTKLVESVSSIAQKQKDMDSDLKEIKTDVKAINARPGKRWESIAEKALLTIVGILVTYIAIKMGLA